jgi:hypothetical protein
MSMYQQQRADQEPWRQAGIGALGNMVTGAFQADPGYAFRLGEGEKAINRGAAARGGYDSGSTLKALTRYGQDYANNEYGDWWNRQAGLAGVGQTATNALGQLGENTVKQQAGNITGAGNARASGYMGNSMAWNNALGDTLNWYNQSRRLG